MIWHGSGTKRPERLTNGKSPGGRQGLTRAFAWDPRQQTVPFCDQIRQGSGIADLRPGNLTEQPGPWFDRVRNLTPEREIGVLGCGPDRVGVAQLLVVELQPDRVRHACATGYVHRHETAQEAAYALDPLEIGVARPTSAARQAAPGSRPATTTGCQGQHHPEAHRSTSNQAHDRAHRDCTRSPPQRRTPAGTTTRPPRRAHGMAAEEGHMSSRPARPPRGMSEHLIERAFTRSLGARLACLRSCSTTQACRCPVRQPQREPGCTQRRRRPTGGNC